MIIIGLCSVNAPVLSDDIVSQSSVWVCVNRDCPMMGLQPPRGVTWEEVVSIRVCNFLLIEGKYFMCVMLLFCVLSPTYTTVLCLYKVSVPAIHCTAISLTLYLLPMCSIALLQNTKM